MDYRIKAIETKFKSYLFRSRLEARWAAMFDLLEWNWEYEPRDFNGWIPDFALYGWHGDQVYVEVKPVIEFPADVAKQIDDSGCFYETLIVGETCPLPNTCDDPMIGWLAERTPLINGLPDPEYSDDPWWDLAAFGQWEVGRGKYGFCHSQGRFFDRITGGYDGGTYGNDHVTMHEIKELWAMAHTATRWMKG